MEKKCRIVLEVTAKQRLTPGVPVLSEKEMKDLLLNKTLLHVSLMKLTNPHNVRLTIEECSKNIIEEDLNFKAKAIGDILIIDFLHPALKETNFSIRKGEPLFTKLGKIPIQYLRFLLAKLKNFECGIPDVVQYGVQEVESLIRHKTTQLAIPYDICRCPNCNFCLLCEEETEAWDDAVSEGELKERDIVCLNWNCKEKIHVTLSTEVKREK